MSDISASVNLPTKIFKRNSISSASATGTDSKGCVQCDETPTCPDCGTTGDCVQTVQTCNECPKTYCRSITGSSSSSGPSGKTIGGLAGGIAGGLLLLLGLGTYLFYKYYWKKKLVFNRVKHKEFYFDDDIEINFRHHNLDDQGPNGQNASSRNSLATTMFTRASNIIPIAYIPGVTIGANAAKNTDNRASQYSEANTIDSDLIGDRYSKASIIGNPSQTTTAIRAKPRLVNVQDAQGNPVNPKQDGVPNTAVNASQLGGVKAVKVGDKKRYNPGLQTEILAEEESDQESVQIAPEDSQTKTQDYEPFIIEDDEEGSDDDSQEEIDLDSGNTTAENAITDTKSIRTRRDSTGSRGSVILEVEIDRNPLSPFDDTYELNNKSD